ncbi:MAG TPA: beta-ketoacyl-[acyl-carrier-protein] synthase family protein [Candidatus Agrococcus pullicola]|uniref:Beta-ketoacyl-[acyl-carrier-protein] synthase family protein n=1 Tax=Candidatus Agrococcus pullicola TaxID=2838429 RepID=A0A9D1YW41_9MICO|nr:beta-ketoacyl-[acyl-carrier-protein] synthase family protein [Candidatus Agrococcus pullicola]
MSGRSVAVTGLGAITPSGNSVGELWDAVAAGRSAVDVVEGHEFDGLPVRIGAQVRGFDAEQVLERSLARRLSPVQQWAVAAGEQALQHAGVGELPWDSRRFAVIAATGSGPIDAMQHATRDFDAKGPRAVSLTLSAYGAPDGAAAVLSQRLGARGPAHAVSATCASGAIGLGDAMRRIRHGYADAVLVVGMEDCLNPINLASNANMRALAAGYEDDPTAASRPFDRSRSGFVMAQGAGAILLEATDRAKARGTEVLAELAGFGESSDAHHATAPHPEGRGAADAVLACLADARCEPTDVRHINAHGTGTPAGDGAELAAFDTALGPAARTLPVSATKSSTGHLLGASGVVEAIVSVMTIRDGLLPPTINLDDPEFEGWDFVCGEARPTPVDAVLSTSFGFGGHNGALLLTAAR